MHWVCFIHIISLDFLYNPWGWSLLFVRFTDGEAAAERVESKVWANSTGLMSENRVDRDQVEVS